MIDDKRIDELETLRNQTTSGFWFGDVCGTPYDAQIMSGEFLIATLPVRLTPGGKFIHNRNARFVCAAHREIPHLIAEIRALKKMVRELKRKAEHA